MFLKSKQDSTIANLLVCIFISILLVSCDGESSSNSDRNEVIDRSVDIDGQEELDNLAAGQEREGTETFNLVDINGNTVSCDSSEVEFDENDRPSCPNAE